MNAIRRRVWEIVECGKAGDRVSQLFDVLIVALIVLSTTAIILESVESIDAWYHSYFRVFEYVCVTTFVIEYLVRMWSCTADERFDHPLSGRLRYFSRPLTVVDLFAIAPSVPFLRVDLRFLRLFRVLRVMRLAALGRYSSSLQLLVNVLRKCWRELAVTLFVVGVLLVMSSCLMYFVEHDAQPKVFPDIPSTTWWAVITITTVGYGDSYPITTLGRVLTAVIALLGVGVLALPTAIIGGTFVEELARARAPLVCPQCGKVLESR